MEDMHNFLDNCLLFSSTIYWINDAKEVLGIVLIIVNIISILLRLTLKLADLKNKKADINEVISVIGSAEEQVEDMFDQITIEEKEQDGNTK